MGAPDDIIYIFSFSFFFSSPRLSCPKYIYLGQKLKSVTQWYRHWLNLNNILKKKTDIQVQFYKLQFSWWEAGSKTAPLPLTVLTAGGQWASGAELGAPLRVLVGELCDPHVRNHDGLGWDAEPVGSRRWCTRKDRRLRVSAGLAPLGERAGDRRRFL